MMECFGIWCALVSSCRAAPAWWCSVNSRSVCWREIFTWRKTMAKWTMILNISFWMGWNLNAIYWRIANGLETSNWTNGNEPYMHTNGTWVRHAARNTCEDSTVSVSERETASVSIVLFARKGDVLQSERTHCGRSGGTFHEVAMRNEAGDGQR